VRRQVIKGTRKPGAIAHNIAIGIIPDDETGWRSVLGRRTRLTPSAKRALGTIEGRLQAAVNLTS
jgi:hypothetical protein